MTGAVGASVTITGTAGQSVRAPDGALLHRTDNVCHGFAA